LQNRHDGTHPIAFIPTVGKDRKRENSIVTLDKEGLQRLFFCFSLCRFAPFLFGVSYGDIGVTLKRGSVVVLRVECRLLLAKQGIRKHQETAQRDEEVD
jgi:hypothetical protein